MADVTMPQLGETVTEGTITKWFKQVGDQVAEDEVLFEVSTDKVDSEVPSPAAGYVSEIKVPEGETVDVGVVLAVISDGPPGDGAEAAPKEEPKAEPAATEPEPSKEPGEGSASDEPDSAEAGAQRRPEPSKQPGEGSASDEPDSAEAGAQRRPEPSKQHGEGSASDEPDSAEAGAQRRPEPSKERGEGSASDEPDSAEARAQRRPEPSKEHGNGKLLSPVVRRLIAEHGLDPAQITGTGAGGRITRNDVLAVVEKAPAASAAAPAAAATKTKEQPKPAPAPARAGERDTSIPFSNIRRRTAEHMIKSKQTSAHVYASIEVDFEAVELVRKSEKDEWKADEGFGLTYLPFISRAVVDAIRDYPEVNSTFGENELIVHNYVNLGIAVDLDFKGLMVPVIQDAETKRLRAIAREVSDLAARARSKKLSPDEIVGGTFTITNPGPFGTLITLPIINQPQVAILSTDGVKRRPVVVDLPDGSEAIAIHSVGNLTLTWDHRAFDGAYATAFLREVKQNLETRDWAQELA